MMRQMTFRTSVDIPTPKVLIRPCEQMLLVGSCFAQGIGQRLRDEGFPVVVNPYGVMYNPISVWHTIEKVDFNGRLVFITLGTNHVYVLKETGEVVDNCQKRPQSLFDEVILNVEECYATLAHMVTKMRKERNDIHFIVTVSPIRYAKYGFHESQLAKAVLLITADRLAKDFPEQLDYFPAYEILNDELRDYRFYAADMLHPSEQAVDYIWQRLVQTYFCQEAVRYLEEWEPLKKGWQHKPYNPDSREYISFVEQLKTETQRLASKYPGMLVPQGMK